MAAFLAGLAFTVLALIQTNQAYHRADTARFEAEISASQANTLLGLLKDLIARSDPDLGKGPEYRLSDALDDFAGDLPDLTEQPKVELELRLILGRAYQQLAMNEKTAVHLLRAISLQKQLYKNDELRIAKTLASLASISINTGRFPRNADQAIQYSQEAIDICRRPK